jgi:hypothetical protein
MDVASAIKHVVFAAEKLEKQSNEIAVLPNMLTQSQTTANSPSTSVSPFWFVCCILFYVMFLFCWAIF